MKKNPVSYEEIAASLNATVNQALNAGFLIDAAKSAAAEPLQVAATSRVSVYPRRKPETRKKGKLPDYRVTMRDLDTGERCYDAGAGWIQDNGEIFVKLNSRVDMSSNQNIVINMIPINDYAKEIEYNRSGKKQ